MKAQLTVLPVDQYKEWQQLMSNNAQRAYDPDDKTAHWGWEWKEVY
jgi:hypothetical protein